MNKLQKIKNWIALKIKMKMKKMRILKNSI